MAFFTLEEAVALTKDPIIAGIFKTYIIKNPLAAKMPFDFHDDVVYKWRTANGVAGAGKREINGELVKGNGSKTYLNLVEMTVYNIVREMDRLVDQTKGDVVGSLIQKELQDAVESVALLSQYDFINSDKAADSESKYDGLNKLAVLQGNNFTIGNGGIAANLTKDNVYDEITHLLDSILGDNTSKVLTMRTPVFTRLNKLLKQSGFETTIATNDFGQPYASFMGSVFLPLGSYVVDAQGGTKQVIDFLPRATFEGVDNTDKIIAVTLGENYVHGVRLGAEPTVRYTDHKSVRAGEQPKVDVEDAMAIVDKSKNAVAVLEGIVL